MKTITEKLVLVIALCALVLLTITPVSAYGLYYTSDQDSQAHEQQCFNTMSFWTNASVSKMDAILYCYFWSGNRLSGTYSDYIGCAGSVGTVAGNYTATWSFPGTGYDYGTVEIVFDDFDYSKCTYEGGMTSVVFHDLDVYAANGDNIVYAKYEHEPTWESMSVPWAAYGVGVSGGSYRWSYPLNGTALFYSGYFGDTTPAAAFSCAPTSQYPSEDVVCTDASTGEIDDWYWTIDAEAIGYKGWLTSTSRNFTWSSAYPGLYSVNLRVNNTAGFDWENKSNYVSISVNATPNTCDIPAPAGYSRTKFRCMNPANDATVLGCDIQLQDVEGGAWSNQSNIASGIWCIDTYPLHHINAYAQATGYTSGSRLNVQEWNNMQYTIPLIPGYVPPAPEGYVWIYVYVLDFQTYLPLSGATVTVSGYGLPTKTAVTGSAGSVNIQWPNATTAYINAAKSGYTTGSQVITTSDYGPDIVWIAIHKGVLTATLTPTPSPGGTTSPTVAPGKNADGTYTAGYSSVKGLEMMNWLAENGLMLVQLCFVVTVMALLGVKFGK